MNNENEISDLDIDYMDIPPEELTFVLGISKSKIENLLNYLKLGSNELKEMLQNFNRENMNDYHGLGKWYAPYAFEIYDRLSKKGEAPRLPTFLSINRYQSCKCGPDTILFWADPDAIVGLYESLEKDGYYAST